MPFAIRRTAVVLFVLASALFALSSSATAAAADCRQRVVEDWSDNGRIDRLYELECYEQAMRSLTPAIRDYTDAADIIDRALTLAVRKQGGTRQNALPAMGAVAESAPSDQYGETAVPGALVVLGALLVGALGLGGVAFAVRRAATGRRGAAR